MKPVSDRELAYKEIVDARKERLAAEAALEPGPVIEAEIEPPEVEAQQVSQPEEAPPQGEPEVETPALVPTEPAAPQLVKAKVDDVEYDVPQEEIEKAGSVAIWQMEKAVQNRLKELNEIIKVAKTQTQPAPAPQPQQNHDAELDAEVETLRYGDPEQARRILKELKAAKVPQDQIVREAVQHIKWENAVEQFAKEHEELLKDPDVRIVAVARENQLRQYMDQTKQWPDFARFYKDLGTHITTKFGKPAAVDLEARRELKATIVEPKTASGRVPTPPPPKAKTTADIINEQRKARGQPIH
jgi:acylphosphatase